MIVIIGIIFMKIARWDDVDHKVTILGEVKGGFPVPQPVHFSISEIQVIIKFLISVDD